MITVAHYATSNPLLQLAPPPAGTAPSYTGLAFTPIGKTNRRTHTLRYAGYCDRYRAATAFLGEFATHELANNHYVAHKHHNIKKQINLIVPHVNVIQFISLSPPHMHTLSSDGGGGGIESDSR